jgi:hypothetical protein
VNDIRWPAEFAPGRAPVHVSNERTIAAEPPVVWAWLVRAPRWPAWYPNAHRVRIAGGASELSPGAQFRWWTFGVPVASRVREFVPSERIAWDGTGIGIHVYHAWLLEPHAGGCRVLTEETQFGGAARLGALLMPTRMHRGHQLWLESLAREAAGGPPA